MGKAKSTCSDSASRIIKIEDVPSTQLFVPIFSINKAVDQYVEAGSAKTMEFDDVIVLPHTGVGPDDGPNPLNERLHLIGRGVVPDSKRGLIPPPTTLTHIIDPTIHQIAIRHANQRIIEGAHTGRSKAYGFDGTFNAIDNNPVADLERLVSEDRDSAQ